MPMDSPTQTVFNIIRSAAKDLRTQNEKADGQKFWSNIKVLLEPFDDVQLQWKEINDDFYDQVMKLPEYDKNGKTIELHHFIIQCVRIPRIEKLNIRKLMQIALNIGQLLPNITKLPQHLSQQFLDLHMISMKTYIGDTHVFDKLITSDLIDKLLIRK